MRDGKIMILSRGHENRSGGREPGIGVLSWLQMNFCCRDPVSKYLRMVLGMLEVCIWQVHSGQRQKKS